MKLKLLPLDLLESLENHRSFNLCEDRDLLESIREFNLMRPLLVCTNDHGTYTIIDGHLRKGAARELGKTEVFCLVRSDLSVADILSLRFDLHDAWCERLPTKRSQPPREAA